MKYLITVVVYFFLFTGFSYGQEIIKPQQADVFVVDSDSVFLVDKSRGMESLNCGRVIYIDLDYHPFKIRVTIENSITKNLEFLIIETLDWDHLKLNIQYGDWVCMKSGRGW